MKILLTAFTTLTVASSVMLSSAKPSASDPPQPKTLEIGATAPDFSLEGVDGKTYSLDSFKDAKYLVVAFTCNHCPEARATWGRMDSFAREYSDKGVKLVAISSNSPAALMLWENGFSEFGDTFDEMKQVAKRRDLSFPYLYDGDKQDAGKAYGAKATPHTFIFGPDRKLLYHGQFDNGGRSSGPAPRNTVKDNMDTILAGKTLEKPVMRTFGCSTKWAWKKDWVTKAQADWEALPVTVEAVTADQVKALAKNDTGKVRVINVWSTTCGPCVAEFPDLIDTYRRYQRRPFDMITISIDSKDDAEAVEKFLKKEQLPSSPHSLKAMKKEGRTTNNYHYQEADLDALADALDPKWAGPMPHTVVVAPGGEILYRHTGRVDPIKLREEIVKGIEGISKKK